MNLKEIQSFEDLWRELWKIIYAVIAFFKGANNGKVEVDVGSNTVHLENVESVYPY